MAPENQCILCDLNLCSCRGWEEKAMCFMEKWSVICDSLGAIASPGSYLSVSQSVINVFRDRESVKNVFTESVGKAE